MEFNGHLARRTLLWIKPQYFGDAVLALPLLDTLAASGRQVVVRAMPAVLELIRDREGPVEGLPAVKFRGIADLIATSRTLRSMNFDEAILTDRTFRSALAIKLAGIPVRVGHATDLRSPLLTLRSPYDELKSEVECFLDLARLLELAPTTNVPRLSLLPDEIVTFTSPTIGFQPGARYKSKQWPPDRLAVVATEMLNRGFEVALFGGKEEKHAAAEFTSRLRSGAVHNFAGIGTIRESMARIAACRAMVGSDTGLMHVAAALGTPTLTLFGPNPSSKWGHFEPPHRVIEASRGAIEEISVEEVELTLSAMLEVS